MPFTTADNAISNFQPTKLGTVVMPKHPRESNFPPMGELMGSWFRRSTGETYQGVKSFFQNIGYSHDEEWSDFDPYPHIPEEIRNALPNLDQYWNTKNPEEVEQVNNTLRSQIEDYQTIQEAGVIGWTGHVATSILDPAFLIPGTALAFTRLGSMADKARRLNRFLKMIEKPGKLAKSAGWGEAVSLAKQLGSYSARSGLHDYPHWLRQAGIYAAEGAGITTIAETVKQQAPTLKTWSQGLENIAINAIASAALGSFADSFGRARLARFKKGIRRDFDESFGASTLDPGMPKQPHSTEFVSRSDMFDIIERVFPGDQGRGFVSELKLLPKGELTKRSAGPVEPTTKSDLPSAETVVEPPAPLADTKADEAGIQKDIAELRDVLEPEELQQVIDSAGIQDPAATPEVFDNKLNDVGIYRYDPSEPNEWLKGHTAVKAIQFKNGDIWYGKDMSKWTTHGAIYQALEDSGYPVENVKNDSMFFDEGKLYNNIEEFTADKATNKDTLSVEKPQQSDAIKKVNAEGATQEEKHIIGDSLDSMINRFPRLANINKEGKLRIRIVDEIGREDRPSGVYNIRNRVVDVKRGARKTVPDNFLHPSKTRSHTSGDMLGTLRHELGHYYYYEILSKAEKEKVFDLYDIMGKQDIRDRVSHYAATDSSEMFAEMFSAYTAPWYGGNNRFPKDIEAFLEDILRVK